MPSLVQLSTAPPHSARVLVVDDQLLIREAVSRYLTRQGYGVETAKDGLDGLEKLEKKARDPEMAFELLITDINMPNLGGVELIHAIRNRQMRLKIIVFSAAFTEESLEELRLLSVDATLDKISMAEVLLDVVDRVLWLRP